MIRQGPCDGPEKPCYKPTSGYRCAADKCLVDYFATVVTINLSDRAVAQQDLHRPNFYPSRRHAQTPETWTLWLYGLGVEILSQRGLDEGGNKLHWRVFLCVARLRGA